MSIIAGSYNYIKKATDHFIQIFNAYKISFAAIYISNCFLLILKYIIMKVKLQILKTT